MFEQTIKDNENKKIHKHIILTPEQSINLNQIQVAYNVNKTRSINTSELINICVLSYLEILKNMNEQEALNIIEQKHNEILKL